MPIKHGMSRSDEYKILMGMRERCYNKNTARYKNYGGRGIIICQQWLDSFEQFYKDMGARPSKSHTIDRINNDGNYCPENCRWATWKEQYANRSINRYLTHDNETICITEWAKKLGIAPCTLTNRIDFYGWTIERALSTTKQILLEDDKINYNGENLHIATWEKKLGFASGTIRSRIKKLRWSIEKAFTTPVGPRPGIGRKFATYKDKTLSYSEWERVYGLRKGLLRYRLVNGWDLESALITKQKEYDLLYNGEKFTYLELAKKYNVDRSTLKYRIKHGYTIDEALMIKDNRKK